MNNSVLNIVKIRLIYFRIFNCKGASFHAVRLLDGGKLRCLALKYIRSTGMRYSFTVY